MQNYAKLEQQMNALNHSLHCDKVQWSFYIYHNNYNYVICHAQHDVSKPFLSKVSLESACTISETALPKFVLSTLFFSRDTMALFLLLLPNASVRRSLWEKKVKTIRWLPINNLMGAWKKALLTSNTCTLLE